MCHNQNHITSNCQGTKWQNFRGFAYKNPTLINIHIYICTMHYVLVQPISQYWQLCCYLGQGNMFFHVKVLYPQPGSPTHYYTSPKTWPYVCMLRCMDASSTTLFCKSCHTLSQQENFKSYDKNRTFLQLKVS